MIVFMRWLAGVFVGVFGDAARGIGRPPQVAARVVLVAYAGINPAQDRDRRKGNT